MLEAYLGLKKVELLDFVYLHVHLKFYAELSMTIFITSVQVHVHHDRVLYHFQELYNSRSTIMGG